MEEKLNVMEYLTEYDAIVQFLDKPAKLDDTEIILICINTSIDNKGNGTASALQIANDAYKIGFMKALHYLYDHRKGTDNAKEQEHKKHD